MVWWTSSQNSYKGDRRGGPNWGLRDKKEPHVGTAFCWERNRPEDSIHVPMQAGGEVRVGWGEGASEDSAVHTQGQTWSQVGCGEARRAADSLEQEQY